MPHVAARRPDYRYQSTSQSTERLPTRFPIILAVVQRVDGGVGKYIRGVLEIQPALGEGRGALCGIVANPHPAVPPAPDDHRAPLSTKPDLSSYTNSDCQPLPSSSRRLLLPLVGRPGGGQPRLRLKEFLATQTRRAPHHARGTSSILPHQGGRLPFCASGANLPVPIRGCA